MKTGIVLGAVATVLGSAALILPATNAQAMATSTGDMKLCMSDAGGNGIAGQVTADGNNSYNTGTATPANNCVTFAAIPTGVYQVRSQAAQPVQPPNCGSWAGPICPSKLVFDHLQVVNGANASENYTDQTVATRLFSGETVKVTFFWK